MTNSAEIQNAYNKFYTQMRNYIWDFKTIDLLADLEIGIYRRFPNVEEVKRVLEKLRSKIDKVMVNDEDFQKAYDRLQKVLSDTKVVFTLVRDINFKN